MMVRTVAIYVRLSLEDDDLFHGKMESESITNQRDLLTAYIPRILPTLGSRNFATMDTAGRILTGPA